MGSSWGGQRFEALWPHLLERPSGSDSEEDGLAEHPGAASKASRKEYVEKLNEEWGNVKDLGSVKQFLWLEFEVQEERRASMDAGQDAMRCPMTLVIRLEYICDFYLTSDFIGNYL
eukprot:g59119.t1